MRIAQIMLAKRFGGAERSFVDLCTALAARDHEVLAICERRSQAVHRIERIAGLRCRSIKVFGAWDLLARRTIRRLLRDFKAEIVHTHLARAAHLAGPAARDLETVSLAKTHNYVDLKYYRAIDHLVPTTTKQRRYLLSQGISEKCISQIPNFSLFEETSNDSTDHSDRFTVVAVGRLVRKKGFDVLLKAVAEARGVGLDLAVNIVGGGPEEDNLKRLTSELQLSAVVTFAGWQESVENCLAGAAVFVLPSRDEPFGIVCLEAMALGIPIIATRTDGPSEILDSQAALLVEVENVAALKEAICLVASDPTAAKRRAAVARDYFNQRYSAQAVVTQYLELYRQLLSVANSPGAD